MSNKSDHQSGKDKEQTSAQQRVKKTNQRKVAAKNQPSASAEAKSPKDFDASTRRIVLVERAIWIYLIIGVLVMMGGLYASSTAAPGWLRGALAFFGIALRVVLGAAVIALIVWWIRLPKRKSGAVDTQGDHGPRLSFRERPVHYLAFVSAAFFFALGVIGILYHFLLPTNFTASNELRSFSLVVTVIAAIVGFILGVWIFRERSRKATRAEDKTFSNRLTTWSLPLFTPALVATMWMLFAAGPLSYGLHLVAQKDYKTVVERDVKGGTAGSADIMCSGFWTAELNDHSFWWPRRVCNIDLATKSALGEGGSLTLSGEASRFGMNVTSYKR
jgi:hypothetical protein